MVGHPRKGLDRPSVKPPRLFEKLPNVDAEDLLAMLVVQVGVVEILDQVVVVPVNHHQWGVEAVLLVEDFNNVVWVWATILG